MTLAPIPAPETHLARFLKGSHSRRFAGYSVGTQKVYRASLRALAAFLGLPDEGAAIDYLLTLDQRSAHALGLSWRQALSDSGLAPASINLKLAVVRSIFKAAYARGDVTFIADVPGVPAEARRDRTGPPWPVVLQMVETTTLPHHKAFIALLAFGGFRMNEVLKLEAEHVSKDCGTISVRGKGRKERQKIALARETVPILKAWMDVRGWEPGRIFDFGESMAAKIVGQAGKRAGVKCSCHQLRHSWSVRCDELGAPHDVISTLLRHASPVTTALYLDNKGRKAAEWMRTSFRA